jgi:hypothetical protein
MRTDRRARARAGPARGAASRFSWPERPVDLVKSHFEEQRFSREFNHRLIASKQK